MKVKELKALNKCINLILKDSNTQYYRYFTYKQITYKVRQLRKPSYTFDELLKL